jgi:predicted TPR repeat methyltransferase
MCFQNGHPLEAAELYSKVLLEHPAHEASQHHLSVIYYELEKFNEAYELNNKLVALNPMNAGYWNNKGNTLIQLGLLDEALESFSTAMELMPHESQFLVNRSNVWVKLGEPQLAMDDLNAAIKIDENLAIAYANRANLFSLFENNVEALQDIATAISLDKTNADFYFNQGNIFLLNGGAVKAIEAYQKACSFDNNFIQAFINLAETLSNNGVNLEAIRVLEEAYENNPDSSQIALSLGECWLKAGNVENATRIWNLALSKDTCNGELRYSLSSVNGASPPSRAPENYVKRLFNAYAPSFDNHLNNNLQYKIPNLIRDKLIQFDKKVFNRVLDLGCGTGLVGAALRDLYGDIDGVDLSVEMLKLCKAKGIYSDLFLDDLLNFLEHTSTSYDLVVAADVFIYTGSLDHIFHAVSDTLNRDGLFAFSIEACHADKFELQSTKRFAHSLSYIENLSQKMGFTIIEIKREVIRQEIPNNIMGFTILLQKI